MIDVFEEFTRMHTDSSWDRLSSEVLSTLVLAKVLQEVGQAITTELPNELMHAYLQVQAGEYRP